MDGLNGLNPIFGGLDTSYFSSRVAGDKIIEDTEGINEIVFIQNSYSRNVNSLACKFLNNPSSLASSIISAASFGKPNFRNHNLPSAPGRFNSHVDPKQEKSLKKPSRDDSSVKYFYFPIVVTEQLCVAGELDQVNKLV